MSDKLAILLACVATEAARRKGEPLDPNHLDVLASASADDLAELRSVNAIDGNNTDASPLRATERGLLELAHLKREEEAKNDGSNPSDEADSNKPEERPEEQPPEEQPQARPKTPKLGNHL